MPRLDPLLRLLLDVMQCGLKVGQNEPEFCDNKGWEVHLNVHTNLLRRNRISVGTASHETQNDYLKGRKQPNCRLHVMVEAITKERCTIARKRADSIS